MNEFVATPCTTELFELGECCRWDEVRGELCWVDVLTGRFFRAHAKSEKVELQTTNALAGMLTAYAPMEDRAKGWIVALDQSLFVMDETGGLDELASLESSNAADVRMNDGSADPWGRFWVGSMAFDSGVGRGSLYRYDHSLGVETVLRKVTISNGLGWSSDRHTMYYVDSGPATVYAFDVDDEGNVSNQRVFLQFDKRIEGTPDGLCVDSEGALWLAMWGGSEVRRYAPTGEQLSRVQLSTSQPSSCAIGGEGGTTLYITTAREDMSDEVLAREPDAGRLFAVDVDVAGTNLMAYRP